MRFNYRLLPASRTSGFQQDDQWTWCGSCIRGDDGQYHLFASCWSRGLAFGPYWVTNSKVVRAVADNPVGPYRLVETVIGPRDPVFWDGRMAHNPTIHRAPDGTYLLFYTGTTYDFDPPAPGRLDVPDGGIGRARANQRIGLMTSRSLEGPWRRPDEPILHPRPGSWDALMTTNPAPCVMADGSIYLAYKSTGHQTDLLRYGMARAERFDAPFHRLSDAEILTFSDGSHIEDAYLWHEDGRFQILLKDMTGAIGGERHGGIHASSPDAIHWQLSEPAAAYSKTIRWSDDSVTLQGSLERPQLLIQDGTPTHLFAATCDGPGGFLNASRSWNLCIPLTKREDDEPTA